LSDGGQADFLVEEADTEGPEPRHHVVRGVVRNGHDREFGLSTCRPQESHQLQAIQRWHLEVGDDEIQSQYLVCEQSQRSVTIAGYQYFASKLREFLLERVCDDRVVFDE